MRYRKTVLDNNINNIVWFNSYGVNFDGTAKKVNDNFSTQQEGIKDSLIQKLSTIQGELWYAINFGVPLMNNFTSKAELDVEIVNIILQHPEVQSVQSFNSKVDGRKYSCEVQISTIYGSISLTI